MDDIATLAIGGVLLVFLLLFIILKNKKDRRELEEKLNQDYHKRDHSNDPENTVNER